VHSISSVEDTEMHFFNNTSAMCWLSQVRRKMGMWALALLCTITIIYNYTQEKCFWLKIC